MLNGYLDGVLSTGALDVDAVRGLVTLLIKQTYDMLLVVLYFQRLAIFFAMCIKSKLHRQ